MNNRLRLDNRERRLMWHVRLVRRFFCTKHERAGFRRVCLKVPNIIIPRKSVLTLADQEDQADQADMRHEGKNR
jgi:hypothetical protein